MAKVEIYTKGYCPYCRKAKITLRKLGVEFEEYEITSDSDKTQEMFIRAQRQTVPQIFIDDYHLGGNDDLQAALKSGQLNELLQLESANV